MNGRKAKQLRRKAERLTIGLPPVAYEWVSANPLWKRRGYIKLSAGCTRAVYQRLKAAAEEGQKE